MQHIQHLLIVNSFADLLITTTTVNMGSSVESFRTIDNAIAQSKVPVVVLIGTAHIHTVILVTESGNLWQFYNYHISTIEHIKWKTQLERMHYLKLLKITN